MEICTGEEKGAAWPRVRLGARWPRRSRWPSGLERWQPGGADRVRIPQRKTSLRNFGNSIYPALPVSFGGDTQSRGSLLSGVYARGSKISRQSALECVAGASRLLHS